MKEIRTFIDYVNNHDTIQWKYVLLVQVINELEVKSVKIER
jgi:hypothetical protein